MPGMSGIELQIFLRAQGRKMPIILITAFAEESVRRARSRRAQSVS